MAGALDILVNLELQTNQASITEATTAISKEANVVKELTAAVENQNKAQQNTQQKVQMTAAEYRKMNEQLQVVKKGSADYTEVLKKNGIEVENVVKKSTSLRAQLRTVREELAAMEIAGKANTAEFRRLSQSAGELQDQIGDTSQRIRVLASDTKFLDAGVQAVQALAGAFAAGQGAIALFGEENEDVQRIIQKVTGALALLNGVQAVANALNKDSALNILFLSRARTADTVATVAETAAVEGQAVATTEAAVATRGLNAALLANPIIAVATVVLTLVTALALYVSATVNAEESTSDLNDELERNRRLLDANTSSLDRATRRRISDAKAAGKSEKEIGDITQASLERQITLRKQAEQEAKQLEDRAGASNKTSAEDLRKFQDATNQATQATLEAETKLYEFKNERIAKTNEDAKKNAEKAAADGKQAADKRNAQQKAADDQQQKYAQALETARAGREEQLRNKELAESRAATNNRIDQIYNETALTVAAQQQQNELVALEVEKGLKERQAIVAKYQIPVTRLSTTNTNLGTGRGISEDRLAGFEQTAINFGGTVSSAQARNDADNANKLTPQDANFAIDQIQLVTDAFFSAEEARTAFAISEQQKRVDAARDGNAVILKAEEERLYRLQAAAIQDAEKRKDINFALTLSQNALNAAVAVEAVIRAANKQNVIALIGTLAVGVAAVLAATTSVKAGFYEGSYTGDGNPRDEAGVVHKREFVFDHKATARIGKDNLEALRTGKMPLENMSNMSVNYAGMLKNQSDARGSQYDYRRLESKLDNLGEILKEMGGVDMSINEDFYRVQASLSRKAKLRVRKARY